MRVSAIQGHGVIRPKLNSGNVVTRVRVQPETQLPEAPSFQSKGKGAIIGFGGGLAIGLFTFGAAAITGGLAIPTIIGCWGSLATGVGGAVLGNKIEDKISGENKKNN